MRVLDVQKPSLSQSVEFMLRILSHLKQFYALFMARRRFSVGLIQK